MQKKLIKDDNNNNNPKQLRTYALHEEACIAIGTCSKFLNDGFGRYYEVFFGSMLDKLKSIITWSCNGMYCLMGESVGNIRFSQDAHKSMKVLLPLRKELERNDDNTAYTFLNQLFARIGRIIMVQ